MTPIEQLKEDYERRAEAEERRYHATPLPRQSDVLGKMRANIYREFAYELGKLMPEEAPEERIDYSAYFIEAEVDFDECRTSGDVNKGYDATRAVHTPTGKIVNVTLYKSKLRRREECYKELYSVLSYEGYFKTTNHE